MVTAEQLIDTLGLQPLPLEGGYYRETYRSADNLPASALPARYGVNKAAGTAIYYLLTPETFSALHRLKSDEVFHFYLGDAVRMVQLGPGRGEGQLLTLGNDVCAGQAPQVVVPRGVWQGSVLAPGGRFALMGTTVAPGFDFADYEAGERERLVAEFPGWRGWVERLCPP